MVAGIDLVFAAPSGPTLKKGPYTSFCLQGETLREKVGGPPIAVHEDHHWQLDGRRFTRFDCDGGVSICLTRLDGKLSNHHGPFQSFSCMDGVAYADHELFAFADRTIGDWYCHGDGRHWAIVIVEATVPRDQSQEKR